MMRSPGVALSIAIWRALLSEFSPLIYVGGLPPIVTVTVSMDCLPLPEVMTSSPHRAAVVAVVCWMLQLDCAAVRLGTLTTIWASLQETTGAFTPPIITDPVPRVLPKP